MQVIHLEFSKLGLGMSGGESCMLAFIRYLVQRKIKSILCTTDNAEQVYRSIGLEPGPYLEYRTIQTYAFEKKHHPFTSYLQRTPKAVRLVKGLSVSAGDVVLCHNSFLPNMLPCRTLVRRRPSGVKIFHWLHMLAPSIWLGFEGAFTGKYQIPRPNVMHLSFSQHLQGWLLPKDATIIVDNPYFAKRAARIFKGNIHVLSRFGIAENRPYVENEKEYDLVWMGRFHPQKGLLDAVDVLYRLRKDCPDAKLLIIGGGSTCYEKQLRDKISALGLDHAVVCTGFLGGEEKETWLRKARLFIMPSYYEGLPLTIMEVYSLGLPVLLYDLPIYKSINVHLLSAPLGDIEAMARKAANVLSDRLQLNELSQKVHRESRKYTTDVMGAEIESMFTNAEN